MSDDTSQSDENEGLTILGALSQLKEDIYKLQQENVRSKRNPLFVISEGELELKLTARRERSAEAKAGGKWKLWVVDAELAAALSGANRQESIQTLRIKFQGIPDGKRPFALPAGKVSPVVDGIEGPVIKVQGLP